MSDFKLKLSLTILSSILFSLMFILLALVLPVDKPKDMNAYKKPADTHFEKMSKSMREGFSK